MNCHLATFLVTLALISQTKGFCGPRLLQTSLTRSAFRAAEWLRNQKDENGTYGEGHMHAVILHSLRLIGDTVELGADHMKAEIIKNDLGSIPGARVGSYILGAVSACHDPQNFSDFNLLRVLNTKMGKYPKWGFQHPYQYSYALMALCSSGANFGKKKITHRNKIVDSITKQFATVDSIASDTLAMQTLALSCLKNSMKRGAKKKEISEAIGTARDELLNRQKNDSTFGENEVTAALVTQALLAAGVHNPQQCVKTMRWLLSRQNPDGSFANKLSTIFVLPSLIGALPYDTRHIPCPNKSKDTTGSIGEKKNITVCVELQFEVNTPSNAVEENGPSIPPRACVEVVNGTNATAILREAANQHHCYNFTLLHTAYGPMIKSICDIEQKPAEKLYWMIYIDGKSATVGIDDLRPDHGSTLLFHYKKLNWG